MDSRRLVVVIGGKGAQGIPIVKQLQQSSHHKVQVLFRNTTSERFLELQLFRQVEPVLGTFASEADLWATFRGA